MATDHERALLRVTFGLLVLSILATVLAFARANEQQDAVNRATTQRQRDAWISCTIRNDNVARLNRLFAGLLKIEQSNQFVDAAIRTQRVKLYRAAQFAPAKCHKPS